MIATARQTAITIGNFDGVHLGHAALVQAAREAVGPAEAGGRVVALTFEPHPMTVLRPEKAPRRLTRLEQRREYLHDAGADEVVVLEPTRALLNQTPQEFVREIVDRVAPAYNVEGPDIRFGRARAGSVTTLRQLEQGRGAAGGGAVGAGGYQTIVVDPVEAVLTDQSIVQVGSSMARWLIEHGRVEDATALLGRPYELWAEVVRGDRRGRTIGFPTANLANEPPPFGCLLPADGIYAGMARRMDKGGVEYAAAISVGTKPTFGGLSPRTCEAYLLDYDGPLDDYGWQIRLSFHHWLRDQVTFAGVEPLVNQLHRDVEDAQNMMLAGV